MIESLQAENADLRKNLSLAGSKQNELKVRGSGYNMCSLSSATSTEGRHDPVCVRVSLSYRVSKFAKNLRNYWHTKSNTRFTQTHVYTQ